MIELRVSRSSGPTGRVLQQLLQARGVRCGPGADAVVCYGAGSGGRLPSLNGAAGRMDKFEQGLVMQRAGVRVPEHYNPVEAARLAQDHFPLLGRRIQHRGGTDITIALQVEDVPLRAAAGAQFFTRFIPSRREFRVWTYRGRHLGTYEKVCVRPNQYRGIGRNYDNGFAFQLVREGDIPREGVAASSAAVSALNLDFGAVDMLLGKDGRFYVLEVNTAPGVEGPGRQAITLLADHISRWVTAGYPRRNGGR